MFFCAGSAQAQAPLNGAMAGVGTSSCGKYLESRADPVSDLMIKSWAQGFLSGLNFATYFSKQRLAILPDAQSMAAYLDKYCRENPLKEPWMGAFDMFNELKLFPK